MIGFNYNTETDLLTFICCNCNQTVQMDCSDFVSEQSVNCFGEKEYSDLLVECPCGTSHYFNLKIPEGEYDELDLEDAIFNYDEINTRKQLRDLMWNKRGDLKALDRNKFNEERKLPDHIQALLKRNNMVNVLLGNVKCDGMFNDEQTEIFKNAAMQIINGEVSILKAIQILKDYFDNKQ